LKTSSPRRTPDQPRRAGMVSSVPTAQIAHFHAQLKSDCEALGLSLTDAQLSAQLALLNHLLHWNALINISAVTEPSEMLTVHIVDSLAALPPVLLRLNGVDAPKVLDVGTGPGLPALPWALVLAENQPTAQIHAVDAVRKKIDTIADFIKKQSLTNITAEHARIESLKAPYDVVTSRAFSSLKNFVTLAGPCVKKGGFMAALKGKMPDEEISELKGSGWKVDEVVPLTVPRLDAQRRLIVLRRG
jgi:16S rRNA (guanine527-N7)-methyltransferase